MCAESLTLCLCDAMPRIELNTKICLVIHRREMTRSSNTGLLALRALVNSEIRIRGEGRETLDLKDLLTPQYRTFLFYPSDDAVELDKELVAQDRRPIQLIVPDGTWRQARKIHSRHHELNDVQRVKISTPNNSVFQLRAQSRPEGMATLQRITHRPTPLIPFLAISFNVATIGKRSFSSGSKSLRGSNNKSGNPLSLTSA